MFRYKTVIGRRPHARTPSKQPTDMKAGGNVLNRITSLGMRIPCCKQAIRTFVSAGPQAAVPREGPAPTTTISTRSSIAGRPFKHMH
jgi:hypothetical protein